MGARLFFDCWLSVCVRNVPKIFRTSVYGFVYWNYHTYIKFHAVSGKTVRQFDHCSFPSVASKSNSKDSFVLFNTSRSILSSARFSEIELRFSPKIIQRSLPAAYGRLTYLVAEKCVSWNKKQFPGGLCPPSNSKLYRTCTQLCFTWRCFWLSITSHSCTSLLKLCSTGIWNRFFKRRYVWEPTVVFWFSVTVLIELQALRMSSHLVSIAQAYFFFKSNVRSIGRQINWAVVRSCYELVDFRRSNSKEFCILEAYNF